MTFFNVDKVIWITSAAQNVFFDLQIYLFGNKIVSLTERTWSDKFEKTDQVNVSFTLANIVLIVNYYLL